MKHYSLFRRIALGLSATMLIACVCAIGWLFVKSKWANDRLHARALLAQARDIAAHIEITGGSVQLRLPAPLAEAYSSSESRYRYVIRDASGQTLIGNSGRVGPLPELNGKDHEVYKHDSGQRGHPGKVLGAVLRTLVGERTVYVQVERYSETMNGLGKQVFEEFLVDGQWLEFLFLFLLVAVCLWIVDRGLRPLRHMSQIANSIGPANAHVRFPADDVPREILPCVLSFNAVLDRLEQGLDRQREFNANAAHQLRTPLAVLMANVQSLEDPTLIERLKVDVDHMARIVSQLLLIAQLDTLNVDFTELVELNALVADVAANLGPIAINADKSVKLERSAGDLFIRTSRFALRAALQNLIENAIKHTPRRTAVLVRISDFPTVDVIDSGAGISEELRPKIFERFWRGDKSTDGAGLGLSIVDKIIKAMHGTISVVDAPGGGAQFTIRLPPAIVVGRDPKELGAPDTLKKDAADLPTKDLAKVA